MFRSRAPSAAPIATAASAEDRDATADDDGRDHRELVSRAGGRVDRAVAGRPEDTGDAGEGAADREHSEHTQSDPDSCEPGRLGVRADRVELTARPVGAEVVGGDGDCERDHDRESRDPGDRGVGDVEERVRQRARDHLAAADVPRVDAADDVEAREGHDETRNPADRGQQPVRDATGKPDSRSRREYDHDRGARMRLEQVGREVGGKAEDRKADREVDIACENHHRLANREQGEDSCVEEGIELELREAPGSAAGSRPSRSRAAGGRR